MPEIPWEFEHLWRWFLEIQNAGGASFVEIDAWSRLTCRPVGPFEVAVLRHLDTLYKEVTNQHVSRHRQSKNQGRK